MATEIELQTLTIISSKIRKFFDEQVKLIPEFRMQYENAVYHHYLCRLIHETSLTNEVDILSFRYILKNNGCIVLQLDSNYTTICQKIKLLMLHDDPESKARVLNGMIKSITKLIYRAKLKNKLPISADEIVE